MDDLLTGESDEERGLAVYKRCKVMNDGGFKIRKWQYNSQNLQMEITKLESSPGSTNAQQEVPNANKDDDAFAKSSVGCGSAPPDNEDIVVKILGLNWSTLTNKIFFTFSDLCSFANSLPFTRQSVLKVTAKIFDHLGFLTPLTIEMKILFQERQPVDIQIHGFSDASKCTYATVVYIQRKYNEWRHCPGELNPVDLPLCGLTAKEL